MPACADTNRSRSPVIGSAPPASRTRSLGWPRSRGAGLAAALRVRLLDRRDQLRLGHLRTAADVQLLRDVEQVLLAGIRVDAARGPGLGAAPAGRLGVARTLLRLRLPMVADLLERVLDRGQRGPMGALALAVLLHGRVVRLDVRVLCLLGRSLERLGDVVTCWHACGVAPSRDAVNRVIRAVM